MPNTPSNQRARSTSDEPGATCTHTSHAACTDGARTASRPGLCVDAKDGLQVAPGELRGRTSGTIAALVVGADGRAIARTEGAVVVIVVVYTMSATGAGTI